MTLVPRMQSVSLLQRYMMRRYHLWSLYAVTDSGFLSRVVPSVGYLPLCIAWTYCIRGLSHTCVGVRVFMVRSITPYLILLWRGVTRTPFFQSCVCDMENLLPQPSQCRDRSRVMMMYCRNAVSLYSCSSIYATLMVEGVTEIHAPILWTRRILWMSVCRSASVTVVGASPMLWVFRRLVSARTPPKSCALYPYLNYTWPQRAVTGVLWPHMIPSSYSCMNRWGHGFQAGIFLWICWWQLISACWPPPCGRGPVQMPLELISTTVQNPPLVPGLCAAQNTTPDRVTSSGPCKWPVGANYPPLRRCWSQPPNTALSSLSRGSESRCPL